MTMEQLQYDVAMMEKSEDPGKRKLAWIIRKAMELPPDKLQVVIDIIENEQKRRRSA